MPLVSTRRLGWSSRRNGLLFHSFVSVPPLPSFLSLSLFVIVAPARRSNTPLPCYGSRTPTHPGPFLFPCKSISLFRASSPRLPRLVAPLVIESATRRYAAQGFGLRGSCRRARLRIPRDRFCRAFPSADRYARYWVTGRADGSRSPLFPSQSSVIGSGRLASTPVRLFRLWATCNRAPWSFLRALTRLRPREIYSRSLEYVSL